MREFNRSLKTSLKSEVSTLLWRSSSLTWLNGRSKSESDPLAYEPAGESSSRREAILVDCISPFCGPTKLLTTSIPQGVRLVAQGNPTIPRAISAFILVPTFWSRFPLVSFFSFLNLANHPPTLPHLSAHAHAVHSLRVSSTSRLDPIDGPSKGGLINFGSNQGLCFFLCLLRARSFRWL